MAWGRASAKESYSVPPPQCQYWFLLSFGNSRLEWEEMEKCRYTAARLCLTVWSPSLVCGREMLAGHDLTSSSVTLLQSHLKQPFSRGVEIAVRLSVVLDFFFFFCSGTRKHWQAEIFLIQHLCCVKIHTIPANHRPACHPSCGIEQRCSHPSRVLLQPWLYMSML